jgi:hypothetical protein
VNHNVARLWVRDNPVPSMACVALALFALQVFFTEAQYTRISIFMIFTVFAFKSWVNMVFAITTHRQKGETPLSIATERYFWSLLCQSVVFSILFGVAFLDSMGVEWFGRDLVAVRNFLRSIAVISVLGVIIYGDQSLEALRDYILRNGHETKDARDVRQDNRTDRQDRREVRQDNREAQLNVREVDAD